MAIRMYEATAAALNEAQYNPNPDAAAQAAKAMLPIHVRDDARISIERPSRKGAEIVVTVHVDWIGTFTARGPVLR